MFLEKSGVSIVTVGKQHTIASAVLVLFLMVGCSSDSNAPATTGQPAPQSQNRREFTGERVEDKQQMQALVDEIIERLKYYDKAPLYENEFSYLHDRATLDDYLNFDHIKWFKPDSIDHINLLEFEFKGDTCIVDVEVVFKGPTGKISTDKDRYSFFYHNGRWIRPTFTSNVSGLQQQWEYERIVREADSAAKAEAEEGL